MVLVHHSPDQTVIGARALSLSLNPLSAAALEGTRGTSSVAPDTTTALSDQENAGADVDPFPSVDGAELIIS
ncbi:hypothetical protein Tco_0234233 [Tanacetum coccineum]